ncbi:hypothetical protein ONZ45_g9042 [Pleurotus djamor]|nr:hypothetical protein ONZ45_g9042 [Pleurotus djamor]
MEIAFSQAAYFAAVRDIETTRYAQLASSMIMIYDHAITFGDEVDLIWNRYYGLASVIMNNYGFFSPHLTDEMRLYALYFLNKKVLAVMVSSFIISTALSAVVMGTILSGITAHAHAVPGVLFCLPNKVGDHFFLFWIPVLCFESLLVGLALFRGFQAILSDGSLFRSGRALVNVLIRDSVLYFLVMFATYLTNMLVWIGAPQSLLEVPIGFSVAMSCVLGNRIILNVRRTTRDAERAKAAREEALASHLTSSKGPILSPSHSSRTHNPPTLPYKSKHHKQASSRADYDTSFFSPPLPDDPENFVEYETPSFSTTITDVELRELRTMKADIPAWTDPERGDTRIGWAI